ncbi:rifin, partial [Plasmodium reichenowi]
NNTTLHTVITRSLCECELYAPANYDNDPQMKEVLNNFSKQTQQRFHEYDERMKTTRQKCKDQCDKEIQKIILKDKLEKQMEEQLTTLETKINTDDIPTCICEKSMADKVEKGCLKCGGVLGGGVMPAFGTIGGTALYALNQLKPTAIATAIKVALEANNAKILAEAIKAGNAAGVAEVVKLVESKFGVTTVHGKAFGSYFTTREYTDFPFINQSINYQYMQKCIRSGSSDDILCLFTDKGKLSVDKVIGENVKTVIRSAEKAADGASQIAREGATSAIEAQQTNVINTTYATYQTAITASIIAIVVIILVMVIIYLILRYRRKKNMKKKLQYIKLLEE